MLTEHDDARERSPRWRVGRRVPKNVYVNDEVAGQFQREEWAHLAVEAVNALKALDPVLKRLARLADALRERTGERPVIRATTTPGGYAVRDYGADLDAIEAALPVTESEGEEC